MMKNYTLLKSEHLNDISTDVLLYEHNKTKAKIIFMKNDDENKTFDISFKTKPTDNSGVFHIIEHSVLSGSKKYPVKDPFVRLMQSSLANYLNAFTGGYFTSYPFATTNLVDFHNLMDVYFDAVFHPNLVSNPMIFLQEGWHYEIKDKNEELKVNGIVYNEMKGDYSDYFEEINKFCFDNLYKDNYYAMDAGGYPSDIINLSYDDFVKTYKKKYHPSNSVILLYGNLDLESELELVNNYLSEFDYQKPDTDYKGPILNEPTVMECYYQGEADDKPIYCYNIAFDGIKLDKKKRMAARYLFKYLFGDVDGYFTKLFLELGIDGSLMADYDLDLESSNVFIYITNSDFKKLDDFISIIDTELLKLYNNGLDKELLKNILLPVEFSIKEKYFSDAYPRGLTRGLPFVKALICNLDPIEEYFSDANYHEVFDLIDTNYFEDLIKELFLDNPHKLMTTAYPKEDYILEKDMLLRKKLSDYKNSLTDEEIDGLINLNNELEYYHYQDDKEEDLDKLPTLSLSDINPNLVPFDFNILNNKDYKLYYSNTDVNGIIYLEINFDISNISFKYAKAISLFADFLSYMPTKNYSRDEIINFKRKYCGKFYFTVESFQTKKRDSKTMLSIGFSCLKENIDKIFDFVYEVLYNTSFTKKNIKDELTLDFPDIDSYLVSRTAMIASTRVSSYLNKAGKYTEMMYGLDFYDNVKKLIKNYDEEYKNLIEEFKFVRSLYSKKNMEAALMCSKDSFDLVKAKLDEFYNKLPNELDYPKSRFVCKKKAEAIICDTKINHIYKEFSYDSGFNGSAYVLSNYLNTDYLWNNIRINGGAYGASSNIGENSVVLSSYRDPNLRRTLEYFDNIYDNVDLNDLDEDTLKNVKISVFSNTERPSHARNKFFREYSGRTKGITREDRFNNRRKVLSTTLDDLIEVKEILKNVKEGSLCVICNQDAYNENKELFNTKRKLIR